MSKDFLWVLFTQYITTKRDPKKPKRFVKSTPLSFIYSYKQTGFEKNNNISSVAADTS